MKEDIWFQTERKYFAETNHNAFKLPLGVVNKLLEKYNKFLQGAVLGESDFPCENLKLTLLYARGGKDAPDAED